VAQTTPFRACRILVGSHSISAIEASCFAISSLIAARTLLSVFPANNRRKSSLRWIERARSPLVTMKPIQTEARRNRRPEYS
jgi:hypothetical protein